MNKHRMNQRFPEASLSRMISIVMIETKFPKKVLEKLIFQRSLWACLESWLYLRRELENGFQVL